MNEKNQKSGASATGSGLVFFFAGFILTMLVGWVAFPRLLYSEKLQPVNFLHSAHQDSQCEDCHRFREDLTYSGVPRLESCRQCHEQQIGDTEAERNLVENYIEKQREIPWLIYEWQPDNVYFSHAPHIKQNMACVRCHRDVTKDDKLPVFQENRLTGYSKTTMKMEECEKCHASQGGSNACNACHK